MKCIKNWVYKAKFVIKNMSKRIKQIGNTLLILLGIILTVAESFEHMFNSRIVYRWMDIYNIRILGICILISLGINKIKLKSEYFLKGTDIKIDLHVMDVLSAKSAIVIPTNTTFDTKMDDEFISERSVQGQFQKKYFESNVASLDSLIEKGLQEIPYTQLDRQSSKNKLYPIGTVSKVTYAGKHYYFVAIADINEYGKTINTKFENIQLALEGLWCQLENKGHIEDLAIPLLGTGRAGIKDASRNRVIKEIIFSFVASAKERKITEKLQICIHPSDLEHKDLELEELNEYLHYMCKYRYVDENGKSEGVAI